MKYNIEIRKNSLINKESLISNLCLLDDGIYDIFIEKSEVGQPKYFANRDLLADSLGYGSSIEKKMLHEEIKSALLPEIFKDPENLNTEDYGEIKSYSTKWLSPKGWNKLNQSFKIWSMSKFGVLLS